VPCLMVTFHLLVKKLTTFQLNFTIRIGNRMDVSAI